MAVVFVPALPAASVKSVEEAPSKETELPLVTPVSKIIDRMW